MTDDDDHGDPPGGLVRRHRPVLAVGLVVVAISAVIALVVLDGRDQPRASTGPATTTTAPPLTGAAAELVGLLETGTKLAFDVRYTLFSPDGVPATVRLWNAPPRRRIDTESGSGAELRRTARFFLASRTVVCERSTDGAWTCKAGPGSAVGSGLLPDGFVSGLSRFSVVARTERIAEREARCFAVSSPESPPAEVCVTADGILVRIDAGSVKAELVELDRAPPPAEIFELPAPVG